MDMNELTRHVDNTILKAFKDGVADGLIHGERDGNQSHHYYNQGYDYGLTLYNALSKYIEDNNMIDSFFKYKSK